MPIAEAQVGLSTATLWRRPTSTHLRALSLVIAAMIAAHALIANQLALHQRLLGAIPGVLAAIAGAAYLRERSSRLPLLEFALLQFYVFWGMPTLLYGWGAAVPVTPVAMTEALVAISLTSVVVWLAHPLGLRAGTSVSRAVARSLPVGTPPLGMWFWVLLLAGAASASGLSALLPVEYRHIATSVGTYYPVLVYAGLRALAPEATGRDRARLLFAVSLVAVAGLTSGMMEAAIRPMLVLAVVYVGIRRQIPFRWVLVVSLAVTVVQPVKGYYRESAWTEESRLADPGLVLEQWREAFTMYWLSGSRKASASSGTLVSRLNNLDAIARTFEYVPRDVGYEWGRAWTMLPVAMLPRAMFPDKPTMTGSFNDAFNRRFGLQDPATIGWSVNSFPLVADAYWNFGWPGVVCVAAFLGALLGMLSGALGSSRWACLSVAAAMFAEIHARTYWVQTVAGIPQRYVGVALACWVIWWLSRGGSKRSPRGRAGIGPAPWTHEERE